MNAPEYSAIDDLDYHCPRSKSETKEQTPQAARADLLMQIGTNEILMAERQIDSDMASNCLPSLGNSVDWVDDEIHGLSREKKWHPQLERMILALCEERKKILFLLICTEDVLTNAEKELSERHRRHAVMTKGEYFLKNIRKMR